MKSVLNRVAMLSMIGLLLISATALASPHETRVTEIAPGVFFRKAQTSPVMTGCNQGWIVFRDHVLDYEKPRMYLASSAVEAVGAFSVP
jgi:hypothetical protein